MTEENKQALIDLCNEVIDTYEHCGDVVSDEYEVYQIARAALTAQPDDWQKRAEAAEAIAAEATMKCAGYAAANMENLDRAETAEAKLAELEKQKPYGYVAESPCSSGYGGMMHEFSIDRRDAEHDANQAEGFVIELFTRPAPAVSLAELVPVEGFLEDSSDGSMLAWQRGWNACRSAILLNIEEAK